jgi:hypothetical protein
VPNIAQGPAQLALAGYTNLFSNALLSIYSGTQPATAETALSGNTLLCTFQFAATPFATVTSSGGYSYQVGSFVSPSVSPAASGIASFARATFALNSVNAGAWTASTVYPYGTIVSSNNSYWVCVGAGTAGVTAPIGTNVNGVSDGGAVWNWINPVSTGQYLGDFTVGLSSSSDIQLGNTTISTGTNVVVTAFRFQTPSS